MFPLYDINRSRRRPVVVIWLILFNLAAFIWQFLVSPDVEQVVYTYGFRPVDFWSDPGAEWLNLFTSMFMHGGWAHLLGNLWFLWVFGDNIEDEMGHSRFLIFYLLGGVAAALTHGLVDGATNVPMIGASGAISAVLGAYILLHPRAIILSLIGWIPVPVPALIYLGYWMLIQFVQSAAGIEGVAFWAHIGGFVFGVLFARRFLQRS